MNKLIKTCFILLFSLFISGCGTNNSKFTETNIEYTCPLCNEKSYFYCSDCGEDRLIWCKSDGYINSLYCENCSAIYYPYDGPCPNCGKAIRIDAKYWRSKNNRNHRDCNY